MYLWRLSIATSLGLVWYFSDCGRTVTQYFLCLLLCFCAPLLYANSGRESGTQTDEETKEKASQVKLEENQNKEKSEGVNSRVALSYAATSCAITFYICVGDVLVINSFRLAVYGALPSESNFFSGLTPPGFYISHQISNLNIVSHSPRCIFFLLPAEARAVCFHSSQWPRVQVYASQLLTLILLIATG